MTTLKMFDPFARRPGSTMRAFADGVRLLWWRRAEDLERAAERAPDAWGRLLAPPEIDASRSFALFAREVVILA
jgi:hypothetical protein